MESIKKLQIYKEQDDYVLRRVNEFGAVFESRHSRLGLIESIQSYKRLNELPKYNIQASDDLWLLINEALSNVWELSYIKAEEAGDAVVKGDNIFREFICGSWMSLLR